MPPPNLPTITGPYPSGTLHVPLSADQRTKICTWFNGRGYSDADISTAITPDTGLGTIPPVDLSVYKRDHGRWDAFDTELIRLYENELAGGGFGHGQVNEVGPLSGIIGWTESLTHVLTALLDKNTWIRIAEFAAGIILVGVGVSAMVKQQIPSVKVGR